MKFLAVLSAFLLSGSAAFCTTICWDGQSIACDSQSTGGHTKYHSTVPKIQYSKTRHATIAAAGDVAATAPIKKFFMTTDKPLSEYKIPASVKPDSFQLLIIYDDGVAETYPGNLTDPTPISAPFAFGSGEDFAMAAMLCGKSAEEAIEVAKQLDLYSGGRVVVLAAPRTVSK
jgi:ATP-dependent protease HslVU (ClpYQ) peptidase subunit